MRTLAWPPPGGVLKVLVKVRAEWWLLPVTLRPAAAASSLTVFGDEVMSFEERNGLIASGYWPFPDLPWAWRWWNEPGRG